MKGGKQGGTDGRLRSRKGTANRGRRGTCGETNGKESTISAFRRCRRAQLMALSFPFSVTSEQTSSPSPPPMLKRNMFLGSHWRLICLSFSQFSGPNVLATPATGEF